MFTAREGQFSAKSEVVGIVGVGLTSYGKNAFRRRMTRLKGIKSLLCILVLGAILEQACVPVKLHLQRQMVDQYVPWFILLQTSI